jgi:hypothetical protein
VYVVTLHMDIKCNTHAHTHTHTHTHTYVCMYVCMYVDIYLLYLDRCGALHVC